MFFVENPWIRELATSPDWNILLLAYCLYAFQSEHIYNPITAIEFSAMFSFQLDNTKM